MGWLGLGAASLARRSRRGASSAISAIAAPALGGLADGDQVQSGLSAGALDTANYAGADGAIASVTASVTINGAAGALADVVSAGDTVSVVITVEDDAGNSRAFFAGARTVTGVAPGLAASDSLSGRTVTIAVDSVSGAPAPATVLTALSLDGASVLGDQTGSGPWSYAVPDSAASRAVAWTVEASNFEGSATVSGSEVVAPSLFAPTITSAPTISGTMAPGQTVTLDAGTYSGTAPITITFTLALDGADVTGAVVSGSYTLPAGTEGQSLVYTETASNGIPPDTTQSATETVQALPAFPEASGGTETAITDPVTLDAYTAHMFTADGPLTVTEGGEFEVLLVGPGGPGGSTWGYTASGAGAGGDVVLQTLTLPAGTYNITLGTVGAPAVTGPTPGTPTTAFGLTALPGGAGGGRQSVDVYLGPADGGGGHGLQNVSGTPTSLWTGAPHPTDFGGGDGFEEGSDPNVNRSGGGGRGAGGNGQDATISNAGDGGPGVMSGITGATVEYGRGAGGGSRTKTPGAPNGASGRADGGPGVNPGDGGGGASSDGAFEQLGGIGGPALVVVRYRRAA